MTGGLDLDRYAHLDSVLHRLEPRCKIAALVIPVLLISSTPRGLLSPFPYYFAAAFALALLSRVPLGYLAARCAVALPFLAVAASLLVLAGAPRDAAAVLGKALTAILLMTLLTSTSPLHQLLWAMRKLGAPKVLNLIVALMHRYALLLRDEYARTTRARHCRTVAGASGFRVHASQLGLLFVRGWERAERVHWAMVSRGFTGSLPSVHSHRPDWRDFSFTAATVILFAAVRWSLG